MPFTSQKYKFPGVPVEAGTPGFNEYGVPLSACCGIICDEHYWAWVGHKNELRRLAEEAEKAKKERNED